MSIDTPISSKKLSLRLLAPNQEQNHSQSDLLEGCNTISMKQSHFNSLITFKFLPNNQDSEDNIMDKLRDILESDDIGQADKEEEEPSTKQQPHKNAKSQNRVAGTSAESFTLSPPQLAKYQDIDPQCDNTLQYGSTKKDKDNSVQNGINKQIVSESMIIPNINPKQKQSSLLSKLLQVQRAYRELSEVNARLRIKIQQDALKMEYNAKKMIQLEARNILDDSSINDSQKLKPDNRQTNKCDKDQHSISQLAALANTWDESALEDDIADIETLLEQYKEELQTYQMKISSSFKDNELYIHELQKELEDVTQENEVMRAQLGSQQILLKDFKHKNQQLLRIIEEIERQNLEHHQVQKYSLSSGIHQLGKLSSQSHMEDSYFNEQISFEMQNMIEKLMKELKYEKSKNKKNIVELKQFNNEIMNMEASLKEKNDKIFQLQMMILRLNKDHGQLPRGIPRLTIHPNEKNSQGNKKEGDNGAITERLPTKQHTPRLIRNLNTRNPNKHIRLLSVQKDQRSNHISQTGPTRRESSQPLSDSYPPIIQITPKKSKVPSKFSLMNLLNAEITLTQRQKLMIISRVIQLYSKKIIHRNYIKLIAQQIEIYNFHGEDLRQMRIRSIYNSRDRDDNEEYTQEQLLWNMAFILQTVLNQINTPEEGERNMYDINVSQTVEDVLQRKSKEGKSEYLLQIIKAIETEVLA